MTKFDIVPKPPGVSIPIFCDVVKVLNKHFGKKLVVPIEQMETVRAIGFRAQVQHVLGYVWNSPSISTNLIAFT